MPRPTLATVSVGALAHNLAQARRCAPNSRIWAVIKADAYGHGLACALRGFAQADGLALLEFDGARRVRELGWRGPVLMLEGAFCSADFVTAGELGLSLVVHDLGQIAGLREYGGAPIATWLKINTGMNRLGVPPWQAARMYGALRALPGVASVGLMTHFANADRADGTCLALSSFNLVTATLPGERSVANSAALLAVPDARTDWVRPGIMLYGASPFAERSAAALGLRPAMSLNSEVIAVQTLMTGDSVGYGSLFSAPHTMRIGIVACGYADGYPRHAPTGTPIAVAGMRTRTLGRVSMDMLAVDLEPMPAVGVGAPVELWGDLVSVDEVAAASDTIGYELLCAVAPRVARRVIDLDT